MRYNVVSALILYGSPIEQVGMLLRRQIMASLVSELRLLHLFSLRCGTASPRKWPCGPLLPLRSSEASKRIHSSHMSQHRPVQVKMRYFRSKPLDTSLKPGTRLSWRLITPVVALVRSIDLCSIFSPFCSTQLMLLTTVC